MHVVHLCSNHPAKPCLTVCTSLCKYAHLETKDMLDMVQDCSACSFGNIQILFHSGSSTSLMLCICIQPTSLLVETQHHDIHSPYVMYTMICCPCIHVRATALLHICSIQRQVPHCPDIDHCDCHGHLRYPAVLPAKLIRCSVSPDETDSFASYSRMLIIASMKAYALILPCPHSAIAIRMNF